MGKLSSLLVLLSLVTINVYFVDSYTLTASVLSQMGFNNQSTSVYINDNNIDSIDPNAFKGYGNLLYFTLTSTNLLTMDIEIFKDAVNLYSLNLFTSSLNKFTNSRNIIFNNIFDIYLSTNLTSLNKPIMNAFASLIRFTASSNLKTIDVHTFESLSNLDFINLGDNLITSFEYLQIPKNLKQLYLTRNSMNYFALSRTMGVLDYLDISYNRFRSFKSMDFTFLANLTYLGLSHNPHAYPNEISGHMKPLVKLRTVELVNLSISTIDLNFFKNNTKLVWINLSQNKISSLDYRAFNGLNDLGTILLDNNNLTKIASGTFSNPYLSRVDLSNNQISEIGNFSFNGSSLEVNLHNNKLTKILPRTFSNIFYFIDLNYNQITEIENMTFDGINEIGNLYLMNNKIEKIAPGSFNNLKISYLALSYNLLTELRDRSFVAQIDFLYLSNNMIEKIEPDAFNYANITQEINLYNNSLTELSNKTFAGLSQLRRIILGKNKLSTIEPGTFANLPNLVYVYLDNNQLTQLDSSMFTGSNNLYGIFVAGNPNLSTANLQSLCPPAATNCQVYY